jgi:hypothetical protein
MTDIAMSPTPTTEWNAAFQELRSRYPKVREPILVALHILTQDPDVRLEDAKARAAMHGTRITAASVSAAQRLLAQSSSPKSEPAVLTPMPTSAPTRERRARRADPNAEVDVEQVVRNAIAQISAKGSAEADRLRTLIAKAIALLQTAAAN